MTRSIILLICIFFSACQSCYGLEVTFKPTAEVKGISITLADVASFSDQSDLARALGSQVVSTSPPPGQEIILQTVDVKRGLTGTLPVPDSVEWDGAAVVRVHRNGVTVGPERIQAIIDEYLKKHHDDLPNAEINFSPNSLPLPFILPTGEMTWDVIPSNPGILSSNSLSIIFSVDGRVRKNISIPGHIKALAPVIVATSTVRRGDILAADEIRIETRDISETTTPCHDPKEILGEKAKRDIRSGTIIEQSWIDIPPMVARGQIVKIILNSGMLHIATTGIARIDGNKNQIIQVRNTNSKKIIYARVTAPGTVEVQL